MNSSAAGGDQATTYLEHAVLRWLKEMLGLPAGGRLLVSGGSMANHVGLAVMRNAHDPGVRGAGLRSAPQLAVYASSEGHSCIEKAVELLGLGHDSLRKIPVDADFRMDLAALRGDRRGSRGRPPSRVRGRQRRHGEHRGHRPALCDRRPLRRGGPVVPRRWRLRRHRRAGRAGPPALAGIDRADSLGIDPHKWMYIPVECGCAIVRDRPAMRDTFSLVPPYLRDDLQLPWFSEFGLQQTRGFRALKAWMTLQAVGAAGYRRELTRQVALARTLQDKVRARPALEVVAAGPLSVVCFRLRPPNIDDAATDALNRAAIERIQADGRVFLTSTVLDGRVTLRACIINFRTQEADLDVLLDEVEAAGQAAGQQAS